MFLTAEACQRSRKDFYLFKVLYACLITKPSKAPLQTLIRGIQPVATEKFLILTKYCGTFWLTKADAR
jgi:hypothetical protein